MSRAKKDGHHLNCYIDRTIYEKLVAHADKKGQTITTAVERILQEHLEKQKKAEK